MPGCDIQSLQQVQQKAELPWSDEKLFRSKVYCWKRSDQKEGVRYAIKVLSWVRNCVQLVPFVFWPWEEEKNNLLQDSIQDSQLLHRSDDCQD